MRLFNRKKQKEYTDQENIIPEVSPSKALEISREYLESLELEYQYSFGEPSICNLRHINLEEEDLKKRGDTEKLKWVLDLIKKDTVWRETKQEYHYGLKKIPIALQVVDIFHLR